MRLVILALIIPLLFSSCTSLKPGCVIQDKLAVVATDVIVSKLQCANSFAVKNDMDALVKNLGLCKTGQLADIMCPLLVDSVVNKLASSAIPAEWGCTATDAKVLVKDALTSACKLIPVSEWKQE